MIDDLPPTNDNRSFAALFRNGPRNRAADIIEAAIDEMDRIGVDRATMIRTLFDYFIHELGHTPEGGEVPSEIEHIENIAIINEANRRWSLLVSQIEESCPDTIKAHS